jgi:hypothetical protein
VTLVIWVTDCRPADECYTRAEAKLAGEADPLQQLAAFLGSYDPLDLASGIAALQLMPENADRLVRLEGAALLVAASLPTGVGRPLMSVGRWKQWLNRPPLSTSMFSRAEDPFETLLTEALPVCGGAFVVFPGSVPDSTFIVRHLVRSILSSGTPFPSEAYARAASALCSSVLVLSDTIARRAGLSRGSPAMEAPGRPVILPTADRFATLRNAVTFTKSELVGMLAGHGGSVASLAPLVVDLGATPSVIGDPSANPLYRTPSWRSASAMSLSPPTRSFWPCNELCSGQRLSTTLEESWLFASEPRCSRLPLMRCDSSTSTPSPRRSSHQRGDHGPKPSSASIVTRSHISSSAQTI